MYPIYPPSRSLRLFTLVSLILLTLATGLSAAFTHPGILLNRADLDRIKTNVANNIEPWKSRFAQFSARPTSSINYVMRGPFATVSRTPDVNLSQFESDASAAQDQAMMWYITGNQAYASNAIKIMNAWSSTLTTLTGGTATLIAGDQGLTFAFAGEIIRHTNNSWSAAGVTAYENMLKNVFYPHILGIGDANWGSASMKGIISIGIFCNDQAKFDHAINSFRTDPNGSVTKNNLPTGENSESGRDCPHPAGGIYGLFYVAEMAWKQGIDLYSEGDNRLLAASEYWCAYNLGNNNIPFQTFGRSSPKFVWNVISSKERGYDRASAEMAYAHYAMRKGIGNTNYTKQWLDTMERTNYDDLFFFHLPGSAPSAPAVPANVTATVGGNRMINLRWSAVSGASSYRIMRNVVGAGWRFGDVVAKGVAGTTYSDTGLAANTAYYYTVSAVSATGESVSSAQVSASTPRDPNWVAVACGSNGPGGGYAETPFEADAYFSGGGPTTPRLYQLVDMSAVANPAPMRVYELARTGTSFSYTIPSVAPGAKYKVRLHFAETYWTAAGLRRFNVSINGTQVLTNYDIYADAGADFKATIKEFNALANGSGQIVIQYTAITNNALASGIEILPQVVTAPSFNPPAGSYTTPQSVTISDSTGGSAIRYTIDGSSPTSITGTVYSGPVTIGVGNTTLKAIAYKSGMTDSAVTSGTYIITPRSFTITASAGAKGSISPSSSVTVNQGASQTFTITPNSGYAIAEVMVDGVSVGAVTTYTFPNVQTNHTISASFQTSVAAAFGSGWTNTGIPSQANIFTASFDATPSASPNNAQVGISNGAQTAYSGFACIVRFNLTGNIDARNGGGYAAASVIPFSAGSTYHFREVINVTAHTYSIYVTPPGGTELIVGSNYAFRTEQNTVTSLNYWGAYVASTGAGTLQVCNFLPQ